MLRDILSSIQALLRAWIIRVIEAAGPDDTSYQEHVPIFQAIESGDTRAAGDAMHAHMDAAGARLMRTLSPTADAVEGAEVSAAAVG